MRSLLTTKRNWVDKFHFAERIDHPHALPSLSSRRSRSAVEGSSHLDPHSSRIGAKILRLALLAQDDRYGGANGLNKYGAYRESIRSVCCFMGLMRSRSEQAGLWSGSLPAGYPSWGPGCGSIHHRWKDNHHRW